MKKALMKLTAILGLAGLPGCGDDVPTAVGHNRSELDMAYQGTLKIGQPVDFSYRGQHQIVLNDLKLLRDEVVPGTQAEVIRAALAEFTLDGETRKRVEGITPRGSYVGWNDWIEGRKLESGDLFLSTDSMWDYQGLYTETPEDDSVYVRIFAWP